MKNIKLGLLLMDALCAGALAVGAAMVLLPAFGLAVPPLLLTVCTVLWLSLFALSGKRPWAPAAVLAAVILAVLAAAAVLGKSGELGAALSGYARRAWEEAVSGGVQPLVHLACTFPIALVFWAAVRLGNRFRLPALWAVSLLSGGLIGCKAIWMPEGWPAPFLLLCAGLILFLPRATLGEKGRLQAQALAALLTLPVLGLAVLLGPEDNGQWRSAAVGHLVQDAQDLWEYRWGGLPEIPVTTMRGMGLQPQRGSLGGDVSLSDTPVITSSQKLLLRGQTLEVYTGSGWEDGAGRSAGNFRYDSIFWQGRRGEAFGLDLPEKGSGPLLDELLTDIDADLRTLRNFRSVFLPYRPEDVAITRGGNELYFNMQGEAYWQSQPQSSVEYHVEGRTWDFRDKDFDQNMLLLEKALAGRGADRAYAQAEGQCLSLPDTLPGWVSGMALELTAGSPSPYAKAMALRDWLSENCEYTLTPGPVDPEQDFVAEFLTGRKGYCTYYASALTVLCRCAGVPARYVTGYGMTEDGRRCKATQATAHAWTEICLSNIGWVPLDALSQDVFQQEAPLPEEPRSEGAAMGQPATPSPTPGIPGPLLTEEPEAGRFDPLALLWAMPAVLAAATLALRKIWRGRKYSLSYVQRRYPETGRAAQHCCAGLLSLLRIGKLTPRPGETPLAFWRRAAAHFSQEDVPGLEEAGRVMDRLRFGETPPTGQEVAGMCAAYAALREQLGKTGGLLNWFRL